MAKRKHVRRKRLGFKFKMALQVELLESRIQPAGLTWVGAGENDHLSNAANWDLAIVPGGADDLIFNDVTGAITSTDSRTVGGIAFQDDLLLLQLLGGDLSAKWVELSGGNLEVPTRVSIIGGNTLSTASPDAAGGYLKVGRGNSVAESGPQELDRWRGGGRETRDGRGTVRFTGVMKRFCP